MLNKNLEWIGEKTLEGATWSAEKVGEGILWILKGIGKSLMHGLVILIQAGEPIFIIVAMIGVFFIMSGNRKLGTKLTSGSFITYILTKAVLRC